MVCQEKVKDISYLCVSNVFVWERLTQHVFKTHRQQGESLASLTKPKPSNVMSSQNLDQNWT